MHKISIIIPVHNAEDYINDTIQSCLEQTYKNIEIILVENGSVDSSWSILQSRKDNNIKIFQIDLANAAAARNYGYQKSGGSLIMFLDADDLISRDKLELQLERLNEAPEESIASCSWAKFRNKKEEAIFKPQPVWTINNPVEWCISSWSGGGMMVPGCWLIPRSVIDKAGLWNENLSLHDDGEFMCRVLLSSNGNVFTENARVYYREVMNSLSKRNQSFEAAFSALQVYMSYENEIIEIEDSIRVRNALLHNYAKFIYQCYPKYPSLLETAFNHLKALQIDKIPHIGGRLFNLAHKVLGFKLALSIKSVVKN